MVIEKTPDYSIYQNKDGRLRVYLSKTHKVMSYPKFLMENLLNRPLLDTEEVHHLDRDFTNNDLNNLKVVSKEEHLLIHKKDMIKYYDKEMICPICGERFLWTAESQRIFYSNHSRVKSKNVSGIVAESPFLFKTLCWNLFTKNPNGVFKT